MDSRGIAGIAQGPSGVTQGAQGAMEAAKNGSTNAAMSSAGERKPMGMFDFLAPLAGIASQVPGPWQPFAVGASALLGGIAGSKSQAQAAAAQKAAQGAQAGAMAGEAGIANELNAPPDYAATLKAENQGINTLKANMGGVANPGALIKDLQGGNIQNAIEGDQAGAAARQGQAAGILNNLSGGYNQIGTQAGAASTAGGNPFGALFQSLPGMIGGGKGLPAGSGISQATGTTDSTGLGSVATGGDNLGSILNPGASATFGAPPSPYAPSSVAPFAGGGSGTLAPPMPANPFAGG